MLASSTTISVQALTMIPLGALIVALVWAYFRRRTV
jgi:hypothetical protein